MKDLKKDFSVSLAVQTDLPEIVAIYNETVPSRMVTADLEPVSVDSRQAWFDAHDRSHPIWVVKKNTWVIAWVSLSPFYGRPAYHVTAEISIYITATERKHGLGSFLLHFVMEQASQLGIMNLMGFVFSHNTVSIKLFRQAGFSCWGKLLNVADMDGEPRSLSIMGINLSLPTNPV